MALKHYTENALLATLTPGARERFINLSHALPRGAMALFACDDRGMEELWTCEIHGPLMGRLYGQGGNAWLALRGAIRSGLLKRPTAFDADVAFEALKLCIPQGVTASFQPHASHEQCTLTSMGRIMATGRGLDDLGALMSALETYENLPTTQSDDIAP